MLFVAVVEAAVKEAQSSIQDSLDCYVLPGMVRSRQYYRWLLMKMAIQFLIHLRLHHHLRCWLLIFLIDRICVFTRQV